MMVKKGLQGLREITKLALADAQVQCAHAHRFCMTYWCVGTSARSVFLRAQTSHRDAVVWLDMEVTLLDERVRQHTDAPCTATDAADTDERHFVGHTDQVRHRMWKHSTSLQSHCSSRHADTMLCLHASDTLTMVSGYRRQSDCARRARRRWRRSASRSVQVPATRSKYSSRCTDISLLPTDACLQAKQAPNDLQAQPHAMQAELDAAGASSSAAVELVPVSEVPGSKGYLQFFSLDVCPHLASEPFSVLHA